MTFEAKIFSDDEIAAARLLYADVSRPLAAIARTLGIAPVTLTKKAMIWGFPPRRRKKPGRKPPVKASKKPAELKLDTPKLRVRIESAIGHEIDGVETKLETGADAERHARTLASLVKTLADLERYEAQQKGGGPPEAAGLDLSAARLELARRLEAIVTGRPSE